MTRRPAKHPVGGGVHLRLINGETLRMRRYEAVKLVLHPYTIAVYLLMWIVLAIFDPSGQTTAKSLELRLALYGTGVAAVVTIFLVVYGTADLLSGRKGRAVSLQHWPVVLASSMFCLIAGETVAYVFFDQAPMKPKIFAILTVFYFVMIEILMQLVLWLFLPRMLAQLRRDPADPDPPVAGTDVVRAGGHEIAATSVLHIEAQGNYVRIVTDAGQYDVPGPFAALLGQMPHDLGLRVHRSHWVARRAVTGHRRKARELVLTLSYGGKANVALPRQTEIMDWLDRTRNTEDADRPKQASDAT